MNIEKWMGLAHDKVINLTESWKDTEKNPKWFKDQKEYKEALDNIKQEVDFINFAAQQMSPHNSLLFTAKPKLVFPIKEGFVKQYQQN